MTLAPPPARSPRSCAAILRHKLSTAHTPHVEAQSHIAGWTGRQPSPQHRGAGAYTATAAPARSPAASDASGKPIGARRSANNPICPESTSVRMPRATASSSATRGLVND